ncbi:hypothetical protein SCUP234_11066 [Seiridium cupressi]
MPIRNPFARRVGNDENLRPELLSANDASHPGFERVDTVGSKASSALSIRSAKSHDNGDYKMSVHDIPSRSSLDSARFPRMPRTSVRDRSFDREPPTAEEGFEDVGLHDETNKQQQSQTQAPKKRSLFARFGDSQEPNTHGQGMSRFIPGRKRAQSGQGAELGSMDRPNTSHSNEGQDMQ